MTANNIDFEPSNEQQNFARFILTQAGGWTFAQASTALGVPRDVLSGWYKDERFQIWLSGVRHQLFAMFRAAIDSKLIEKAMEGSYKHMELYYSLSGDIARVELEKSETIRQIDSMGVSDQFKRLSQRLAVITGRISPAQEAEPGVDIPRIQFTQTSDEGDDEGDE